jgi:hypothetical protein
VRSRRTRPRIDEGQLEYELTPDAIDLGLDAALPAVIDLTSQIGEFGRGERIWPDGTYLIIWLSG